MTDRPILLTGSTGQVGAVLARTLPVLGEVVAPHRSELDLADPEAVRRAVRDIGPMLIVNAAAYTAVDRAEEEPELAETVNHLAVKALAEAGMNCKASIVQFSTDYVFDGGAQIPYRPTDATAPLGIYGMSKRAGEHAIVASGADHLILRTSWVYSTRGSNFLLTMLRLASERNELGVVDDQTGTPTWADWLATTTTEMIRARVTGNPSRPFEGIGGIYHLTNSGQTTWCGFARAIVARAQLDRTPDVIGISTLEYPTPATRPSYSVLDCTKTEQTFGIRRPTWEQSLDQAMRQLVQNGESNADS